MKLQDFYKFLSHPVETLRKLFGTGESKRKKGIQILLKVLWKNAQLFQTELDQTLFSLFRFLAQREAHIEAQTGIYPVLLDRLIAIIYKKCPSIGIIRR